VHDGAGDAPEDSHWPGHHPPPSSEHEQHNKYDADRDAAAANVGGSDVNGHGHPGSEIPEGGSTVPLPEGLHRDARGRWSNWRARNIAEDVGRGEGEGKEAGDGGGGNARQSSGNEGGGDVGRGAGGGSGGLPVLGRDEVPVLGREEVPVQGKEEVPVLGREEVPVLGRGPSIEKEEAGVGAAERAEEEIPVLGRERKGSEGAAHEREDTRSTWQKMQDSAMPERYRHHG